MGEYCKLITLYIFGLPENQWMNILYVPGLEGASSQRDPCRNDNEGEIGGVAIDKIRLLFGFY